MHKPKLIVCLPGSNFSQDWLIGWNDLNAHLQMEYRVTPVYASGCNIYEVRNGCVESIAENVQPDDEPEYILWIDSDNVVSVDGFYALRKAMEAIPEASGVGAWYLMKVPGKWDPMITAGSGDNRPTVQDVQAARGRLLPVEYIGFGFLLMRFSLIESMGLGCFKPMLRGDGDFEEDDVSFCLRANESGAKFFLHSGVHSPHLKLFPVPVGQRVMAERKVS